MNKESYRLAKRARADLKRAMGAVNALQETIGMND